MPHAAAMAALEGDWVTSYSGYQLLEPRPAQGDGQPNSDFFAEVARLPPLIGAYQYAPPGDRFELRNGYFLMTVLIRLKLDGVGGVTGKMEVIRGRASSGRRTRSFNGTYVIDEDDSFPGQFVGELSETHDTDSPQPTTFTYSLVVRTADEIEYYQMSSSYRHILATGTLRRVDFNP